jgi:YbbR domain-containing protein
VRRLEAIFRWLKDAIAENTGLKLISLLFAVAFYAFINGAQTAQRVLDVSILTLSPKDASSKVLVSQTPATVRVTIQGPRGTLDDLRAEDVGTVLLDLRHGSPSYAMFDPSTLKLPTGARAELETPGIPMEWDELTTRTIPIQVVTSGAPIVGYALDGLPIAEPRTVRATGPKSLVDTLQHVRSEPFDMSDLPEGEFTRAIRLPQPPARVSYDLATTNVTVTITRARLTRIYSKVPVHVLGVARGKAIPPEVDITVTGPPELLTDLRPEQVLATADARPTGMDLKRPGKTDLPVIATLEGCTTAIVPARVVVSW